MLNNESVAFVGWHEGSAGQIHSWFEDSGFGHVAYFIHPENSIPEIKKIPRSVSNFSYPENGTFKNVPIIFNKDWPEELLNKGIKKVLVTISDPIERGKEIQKAVESGLILVNAIHPSSIVLKESILGKNVIVHAKAIIGYRSEIDDGVIINIGSQIDHHCKINKNVTIDPGVTLAGNVLVEEFCTIHTSVVIINRIKIGKHSILGAGTVVVRDVESYSKILGIPGKRVSEVESIN
jgi:sugar O-acyltransferase (sialic acid O-acetyltransferase NeuD family)